MDGLLYNLYFMRASLDRTTSQAEILAFAPSDYGNNAQLYSETFDTLGMQLYCDYGKSGRHLATRMTREDFPRVLLYTCPVPPSHLNAASLYLRLTFRYTNAPRYAQVPMHAMASQTQREDPQLGLCVSPVSGSMDIKQLLEWRIHHASLGFDRVYWYDRNTTRESLLRPALHFWNRDLGTRDVWQHAPHLLPVGDDTTLYSKGDYADQVAYYMDCLATSRSYSSQGWLAFLDLDEWILPATVSQSNTDHSVPRLADILSKRRATTASVCIQRTSVRSPPRATSVDRLEPDVPIMLRLSSQHVPSNDRWNYKCIHRIEDIETLFVHWPESLRQTGQATDTAGIEDRTQWLSAGPDDDFAILHARLTEVESTPYRQAFELDSTQRAWAVGLQGIRDRLFTRL